MTLRKPMHIVAVVFAILGTLALAAPASADPAFEFDYATSASYSGACLNNAEGSACGWFAPDGDHFYVKDAAPDGHSAAIYWHNILSGSTVYRWGACVNSLGNGHMGQCNKNFYEGSKIEWKVCLYDNGNTKADPNSYYRCTATQTSTA